MSKYHNDQPIQGGDNDPDLLSRAPFAEHLSKILLLEPGDDCLTVSLEGEWGYGKTSSLNLVKTSLAKSTNPPILIEYNPWLAGRAESLIQDFLLQFSSQLGIAFNEDVALKASKELISYSSLFGVLKLIPGVEPWASLTENVLNKSGNAIKDVAKLKKLDLLERKNKVRKALAKINTPIVVFIDDIDRLTPDETFQVLRLVKAVADFPGTSFLLAFDPKYLYTSLKSYHIDNANEYIDKVIQLRVPLPVISDRAMENLSNIELSGLSDKNLTDSFENDQDRLSWVYHKYVKHLIKNPRELKRFFNHLRFIIEQVEGQVSFSDLFCLSALSVKANGIYEHIKTHPEAYIGKYFSKDSTSFLEPKKQVEELKDERDKELKELTPRVKRLVKGLLGELFPLLEDEEYSFAPYNTVGSEDMEGRVSAPQRLYVAFHYATPLGYISDQDILSFIQGDIDRKEFVRDTIKDKSEVRFFELISNYSKECRDKEFEILCSIYDVHLMSENLKVSLQKNYGFMNFNVFQQMTWLTNELISKSQNKEKLLTAIINREENAPISASLTYSIRAQIKDSVEGSSKELWLEPKKLHKLENQFTEIATKVLKTKHFLNTNLEPSIFYALKWSSKPKTSKLLKKLLDENKVQRIAEIIGNSGNDSTNGPYVHITEEQFGEFVNFRLLKEKAQKELSKKKDLPIPIKATLKSISNGNKYYLGDGKKGKNW